MNGCFILGLDGDTPVAFDATRRYVRESGRCEVRVAFLTAFPGTPLHLRLKTEGRILLDQPPVVTPENAGPPGILPQEKHQAARTTLTL